MILFIIFSNFKMIHLSLRIKNDDEEFICLPCIYWLPKMPKILPSARFIIAGKKCIEKGISKHVTSAFKLCYSQITFFSIYIFYTFNIFSYFLFFIYSFIISNKTFPTCISMYLYIYMFVYMYFHIFFLCLLYCFLC